jgi:catechol 2,3-dioxygenase-like lactoylglutathione lyase family enzyme
MKKGTAILTIATILLLLVGAAASAIPGEIHVTFERDNPWGGLKVMVDAADPGQIVCGIEAPQGECVFRMGKSLEISVREELRAAPMTFYIRAALDCSQGGVQLYLTGPDGITKWAGVWCGITAWRLQGVHIPTPGPYQIRFEKRGQGTVELDLIVFPVAASPPAGVLYEFLYAPVANGLRDQRQPLVNDTILSGMIELCIAFNGNGAGELAGLKRVVLVLYNEQDQPARPRLDLLAYPDPNNDNDAAIYCTVLDTRIYENGVYYIKLKLQFNDESCFPAAVRIRIQN